MNTQAPANTDSLELPAPICVHDSRWQELSEIVLLRAVAATAVGLNTACGRIAGTAPSILTYHRIADNVPGLTKPLHNVTPEQFRRQLTGLLKRGFTPWPLDRLLKCHAEGTTPPPRVFAITFDDGFETVYTRALPVLRDLGIPATLFINTIYMDRDEPFSFDEWGVEYVDLAPSESFRPLSWAQCQALHDSGLMQFGAHTHTHQDFRGRPNDFVDDLRKSVDIVRERFDCESVPFAFPFGSPRRGHAGPELVKAAKACDVTCGLTTEPTLVELTHDPFTWGRFNAFPWDSPATLAAKLDGWYGWAPKLKHRIAAIVKQVFASGSHEGQQA